MICPEFRFVEIDYSISKAGLNVKRHKKEIKSCFKNSGYTTKKCT